MEFLLVPVLLITLGVVIGRSHERSLWEKRLAGGTGLLAEELTRLTDAVRGARRAPAAEPTQLADAIDAIAIEVERIGEGQRFLTKVLAEREARARDPRSTSPLPGAVRSPLPPTT